MRLTDAVLAVAVERLIFHQCGLPAFGGVIDAHGHEHVAWRLIGAVLVLRRVSGTDKEVLFRKRPEDRGIADWPDADVFRGVSFRDIGDKPVRNAASLCAFDSPPPGLGFSKVIRCLSARYRHSCSQPVPMREELQ